ncbi:MAG: PspC domain-containing protein, partial [Candidatus Limnocylindria bacterium]
MAQWGSGHAGGQPAGGRQCGELHSEPGRRLLVNGRLTRSRDAMIGGVAAGVAAWVKVDPALVRIAWALLV